MKNNRHIPSRYITYHFICRQCGESDVRELDKFQNPKQNLHLSCQTCVDKEWAWEDQPEMEDIWGYEEGDELPF